VATAGVLPSSVSAMQSAALRERNRAYTSSSNQDGWRNSKAARRSAGSWTSTSPSRETSFLKFGGSWKNSGPSRARSRPAVSQKNRSGSSTFLSREKCVMR
jgi:hypothetical protein